MSFLGFATNSYTALWEEDSQACWFGRASHAEGEVCSRLDFVARAHASQPEDLVFLLEELIRVCGTWGARYILADIPTGSDLLPAFRRADFSVWSQERIYRYRGDFSPRGKGGNPWRQWTDRDVKAMQALHRSVVPRLFQNIEPLSRKKAQGLAACDQSGKLIAFADLVYGPKGIWLQPMLDPEVDAPDLLRDLVLAVPNRFGRAVYLSARSYQARLGASLAGQPFSLEQEISRMTRPLVIQDKLPALEGQTVYETNNNEGGVPVTQCHHKKAA